MKKVIKTIGPILLGLIGLILVFTVPYKFPPRTCTVSASYDYGFNNTVGILLLGVFSILFLFLGFKDSSGGNRFIPIAKDKETIATRSLVILGVISAFFVLYVFLISGEFGFGEANQFFLAMDRVGHGETVYKDFDFYYGPLLIYIPYFLKVFVGSSRVAYFIGLFVFQILGLLELSYILNRLPVSVKVKKWALYILILFSLPLHGGINLILFRFITPFWGLLVVHESRHKPMLSALFITFIVSVLIYGISIEYGLAFSFTLTVYFIVLSFVSKKPRLLILLAVISCVPVLYILAFQGLFSTVLLYLTGGWRWPFVPSVSLVLFFTSVFLLAFCVGNHLRDVSSNLLFLSLCLLSFACLPAALGRCDPVHVFYNGFFIMIFAYVYISRTKFKRIPLAFCVVFIVAFGVLNNYSILKIYSSLYKSHTYDLIISAISEPIVDNYIGKTAEFLGKDKGLIQKKILDHTAKKTESYDDMFNDIDRVIMPYYFSDEFYRYFVSTNKMEFLYFKTYSILTNETEVERAIREIDSHKKCYLVLPVGWDNINKPASQIESINLLFVSHYNGHFLRNSNVLLTPIVEYIKRNYKLYRQSDRCVILARLS
jgi:hypothetical protein